MPRFSFSQTLRSRLESGGPVLVLTGAGVSAESGLATFRGPGGLWEGRPARELATPQAFRANPLEVWRFYDWRRAEAAKAEPNPGHRAIARLQLERANVALVTQNVDGLHQRAGSREVVELHGSLWTLRCTREGRERVDSTAPFPTLPPRCECGATLRPGVVWFGESLPVDAFERARALAACASLVLVVGTSSLVYPAAELPRLARSRGAWVVEVNPENTALTPDVDEHVEGPSGRVLPALLFEAA
ncbi:MAG TPA: NAD-dependent deacylase [Candidatus Polarisedimenticolaceae bacterium]